MNTRSSARTEHFLLERVAALQIASANGCVGPNVALQLAADGWNVTAIDEEEALDRLGEHWNGGFVVGHGVDVAVLRRAGIEDADAVVVAADGDDTNIVVAQAPQKRFGITCVVARILDPARATFYESLGLQRVCHTQNAISVLTNAVGSRTVRPAKETTS